MKKLVIAGCVGAIAAIVLLWFYARSNTLVPIIQGGFVDADIRACENTIREYYLEQFRNSPSEIERQQIANGSTTVEAHMIKVSERRLEGFARISLQDQQSRDLGLSQIMETCEATMEMNSSQYIWKCKPER